MQSIIPYFICKSEFNNKKVIYNWSKIKKWTLTFYCKKFFLILFQVDFRISMILIIKYMFLKLNRPKGPYNILKLELRYTTSRQLEVIWQNIVFHKQENVVVIPNSHKTHFSTNDRSSQLCSYRHLLMFIEQLWSTQHYFVNVGNKKQDYYTYGKVSTNFGTLDNMDGSNTKIVEVIHLHSGGA